MCTAAPPAVVAPLLVLVAAVVQAAVQAVADVSAVVTAGVQAAAVVTVAATAAVPTAELADGSVIQTWTPALATARLGQASVVDAARPLKHKRSVRRAPFDELGMKRRPASVGVDR